MSTATKIFGALTVALSLSASSASAQWVGGSRTWSGHAAAASQPVDDGTSIKYAPFVSDYGSYWGQDNYDTVASYFGGGQTTVESCWQSWTGSAVSCPNPTTSMTTSETINQYIDGFGDVGSVDMWDYFYVEFVTSDPASFEIVGVYWQS